MKKFLLFSAALMLSLNAYAAVHNGTLEGHQYSDNQGVYSTKLPSIEGEMRDQPNAISVFERSTSSQDSLEYYEVPDTSFKIYEEIGAERYHAQHTQKKLIDTRYKSNFKKVEVLNQRLLNINDHDVYISLLSLPEGSSLTNDNEKKKDMVVVLATLIVNKKLFIYQIASTSKESESSKPQQLGFQLTQRLKQWIENTEFKS